MIDCGNLVVNVTNESWLATKNSNADYYTISAVNSSVDQLILEVILDGRGDGIVNHFSSDGLLLASFSYENNQCVEMNFVEIQDSYTRVGGDRKKGEKYFQCVKRVYSEESDTIEENYKIFSDFCSPVANGIALFCAIVGCGEYE